MSSGVSLPVTRPIGRALVVGNPGSRSQPLNTLQQIGYGCAEMDDPYAAMTELCRRPLVYRALILSLSALYREELALIPAVKRRFPHIEIWLAQTDGRQAALADGMRLGADGLLAEDGLHRIAVLVAPPVSSLGGPTNAISTQPLPASVTESPAEPNRATDAIEGTGMGEPVLTADELRALLHEQPSPPIGEG